MKKVLIVDDDAAVTNYLMVVLMQTEQYEPTVINDSREIPELLDKETFDAILLDMDMPNLSGMDILKGVREKEIETPVIILTGVNDVELAVKALKLGAFDYLTKPVEENHLLDVIGKAILHRTEFHTISQMPAHLVRGDLINKGVFQDFPSNDTAMIRIFHETEKLAWVISTSSSPGSGAPARPLWPGPFTRRVPGRTALS